MTSALLALVLMASPFCQGFERGWSRGWCAGELECVPQVAPACPVAQAGKSRYEDGYDLGFERGREAKQRFRRQ